MDTFLRVNGWEMVAEERDIYALMVALASGQLDKTQLAQWLRENCLYPQYGTAKYTAPVG